MTRIHWIQMTRMNWLEWRAESNRKPARYLEHRIVYCADCETRRALSSLSGILACSVCGSQQWMHLSTPKPSPAMAKSQPACWLDAMTSNDVVQHGWVSSGAS